MANAKKENKINDLRAMKPIVDFPQYVIDIDGHVYNIETGLCVRSSKTKTGAVKINLYLNGFPSTRSIPRLVAEAYVVNDKNPNIFDTPIHLDNDLTNNHADNLLWRPRWFAIKYYQQHSFPNFNNATSNIQDLETGEKYIGFVELCHTFGILYFDVFNSCVRGDSVFPIGKKFVFL